MTLNFGDATQRALAFGTEMDPEVREWAANFLMERFRHGPRLIFSSVERR